MPERHSTTDKKDKKICNRKTYRRGTEARRDNLASCIPKSKIKEVYSSLGRPYNIIEKTSEVNYKISKDTNSKKWQRVRYNRLKPVEEKNELPRMETRSSHQDKRPSRQKTYEEQNQIKENNQTFTPKIISRQPKLKSPFKWMDEDEEFFYDFFAERERSTKGPLRLTDQQNRSLRNKTKPK